MAESAAIRALRAMDLIPYILENPGISISNLSEKFSVSEKQIESDLQLIFLCGLPGYTPYELIDIVFEDGTVTIVDPQVLSRPRRFSKTELISICIGLKIISELDSNDSSRTSRIRDLLRKLSPENIIEPRGVLQNEYQSNFVSTISEAIVKRNLLEITYTSRSKDETTSRSIAPLSIFIENGNSYLSAVDVAKQAERVFRLDLLQSCVMKNEKVPALIPVEEKSLFAEIMIDERNRSFIEENSSIISEIKSVKNHKFVTIKIEGYEWLIKTILSMSPDLSVIKPSELKHQITSRASEILALYAQYSP
jgi:proteasome accessory factor C